MGCDAARNGAEDAAQPGLGAAAGARAQRAARDARPCLPAEPRPGGARSRPLRGPGGPRPKAEPERAAEVLRLALDLWRGAPLADLEFEPFAQTEILRLQERRWAAFEAWAEAELALGRHADLVAELEAAVAEQPLRERLHGGADAGALPLRAPGRRARGLPPRAPHAGRGGRREPGADLRALQQAILAHDPALDPLGDEDVAEIARSYGVADAGIAVIVEKSHGDARAARRKAAEWAAAASAGAPRTGGPNCAPPRTSLAGDLLARRALDEPEDDMPRRRPCAPTWASAPFDAAHARVLLRP